MIVLLKRIRRFISLKIEILCPKLLNFYRQARARQRAIREWEERIQDVLNCPDSAKLPRAAGAGAVKNGFQTMHNGLLVQTDGYYGSGMTELLKRNRGLHEPQEELVFAAMLERLSPGATIMECGAYWGFYSMWFLKSVPQSRAWLIEPEAANLAIGRGNFSANNLQGHFTQAWVSEHDGEGPDGLPMVSVDGFMAGAELERLTVLHADIQGAEADMLRGAAYALGGQRVDYVFVSTHGNVVHHECAHLLQAYGYVIVTDVDIDNTFSVDGLIVAVRPELDNSPLPIPSQKLKHRNP